MYMRLAFAVAARLEPEILLVDEVLAVGDLAFQNKCLGKMDDVSRHGRTILFVSHQMNQLRRLCSRCIWLESGRLVAAGPAEEVINRYEASFTAAAADTGGRSGTTFLTWTLGDGAEPVYSLRSFGRFVVRFSLQVTQPIRNGHHGIVLKDGDGKVMWGTGTDNLALDPGSYEIVYSIDGLPVRPGVYRWLVTLYDDDRFVTSLDCVPELSVDTQPLGHRRDEWAGILNLPHTMRVDRMQTRTSADNLPSDATEVVRSR